MSSTVSYYHELRQKLIVELGGECARIDCCTKDDLEFHHVNEDGTHACGGWQQLYEIANRIKSNYEKGTDIGIIVLCKTCHKKLHDGDLDEI